LVFADTQNQPGKTKRVIFLPSQQNENIVNEVIENIELKKLADIENISVRTYNICAYNDLIDLDKILQYFWENSDFKKLRNCGNNSNQELIDICNKYKYSIHKTDNNSEIPSPKNEIIEIIENLTVKQKAVINNIISARFKKLTQRSNNALSNYLRNITTLKSLKESIFINPSFEISSIKNVGEKSVEEIESFLKDIKEFIILISVFEDEQDITKELFNTQLEKLFSVGTKTLIQIGEDHDFSEGIPIFKTINMLIEKDYIFNEKEKVVFQQSLGFYRNRSPLTLDNIGNIIGLTRERTRQIRNKLLDNFDSHFSFVSFFEKEILNLYKLDITSPFLNINRSYIDELSINEKTNYNVFFINRIFSIILEDKYSLIGNEEKGVLGKKRRKHHDWNSTYLISKQAKTIFDFEKLINDIGVRLSEKIEEDYKFHFQTYLLNFENDDCYVHLDEISQIAEEILYNEFEIIIDSEDNISFLRNSKKTILDYIYKILKGSNKPLTVYEIFDILNQQYPGISKSAEALRGSCQRDSRLIYFGRSSTYGLKIWEEKLENIKGGTMHDISEEFLQKLDEPKHIDEITEFVSNYRADLTSKNLFYNLKSAEHKRFVFFKNKYIGLVTKTYNDNLFTPVPKHKRGQKVWDENYKLLKALTDLNKKLPNSNGSLEEKKLYFFFQRQKRLYHENKLHKEYLIRFFEIIKNTE